jgi:hypothetical protein
MQNSWDVSIQRGWIIGLTLVAFLLAVTVGLIVYAISSPISIWLFLMSVTAIITFGIAIRLVYQIWGLISASYTMDRNAVVIHWGGVEHVVPMSDIREVVSGSELQNLRLRPGIRWPGCFLGIGAATDTETILFYATQPLAQQVVLRTETVAYAISPADIETFLLALRERLEMGPTQELEQLSTHPLFLDWDIWRDRWGMGLLLGAVMLLVALVGLLCWRYPSLPSTIALRFTADGAPMLVTDNIRIFYLALLGLIFTCVNGGLGLVFYRVERTAAYFLWSGLLVVMIALWTAVIQLLFVFSAL